MLMVGSGVKFVNTSNEKRDYLTYDSFLNVNVLCKND